jgi:putative phosphoesterase
MTSTVRLALVSDVHGNLHALERVLGHAEGAGVDGVACLGDVCTLGPRPREVLDLLSERARWFILGNHDEYMDHPELLAEHSDAPVVVSAVEWCRAELRDRHRAVVRSFANRALVDLGGGAELLLFHGSPESNTTDVLAETPPAELDDALRGHDATVLAGGHTHVQMVRQHRGSLVVNPGSVGMPFESFVSGGPPTVMRHAEYAIVEARGGHVGVTLNRVELDRAALIEQARDWQEPMAKYLLSQYQR